MVEVTGVVVGVHLKVMHEMGGRLIAGLNRNVFPAEGRCNSTEYAEQCTREFLADTLSKGTVGGVA